jgi:hypothetical protein
MEVGEGQAKSITKPEFREVDKTQFAPFLGGLFSAGGMIDFKISNDINRQVSKSTGKVSLFPYTRIRPIISYSDNRRDKINRFQAMFGGHVIPHSSRDSYRLEFRDHEAVELVTLMQDFLPSRELEVKALQAWADTTDTQARMAIALQLKESAGRRSKPLILSKDIYKDLVNNPLFLAGVFESRGFIFIKDGEQKGIFIRINSENDGLLRAIQEKYGGAINSPTPTARELTLAGKNREEFIGLITPHLISPLSEYEKRAA